MSRPSLDRAIALGYLEKSGVSLDEHPVVVLGIRGGLESVPGLNKLNMFDDTLAIVTRDKCEGFHGNTDPSAEKTGEANLKPGLWRYKPGMHHIGKPNEYAAFVQAGPVTVKRWEQGSDTGYFGINIHRGGQNTAGSEGCQTIRADEWDEFHAGVLAELAAAGATEFLYVLVERSSGDA